MKTMYKGLPTKGLAFYKLLFESEEFNIEMGKMTLAAGRIEAELILYLKRNGVTEDISRSTFGGLIKTGKKYNLFDKNLIISLEQICNQRNYLTHNIYALFTDLLEETILEKHNLVDTDVITYIDRAWELKENLVGIADIINKM